MSVKGVVLKAYFDINVLLRHFHKDLWVFFFVTIPHTRLDLGVAFSQKMVVMESNFPWC